MPQDAFSLRFICKELNNILSGGKVNKIIQPNNDEVIFFVYTGVKIEKICISVNPSFPRIGIADGNADCPLTAFNFCMLLRKHLQNSTVEGVFLEGFDRIVRIDFLPSEEFFDAEKKQLYVELMGRYSNIILTENGKILGGNRGINFFDNGVRPLLVGGKYVFPPVSGKKEPKDVSLIKYFEDYVGNDFSKYVFEGVSGIALSTVKELCLRYEKDYVEKENFSENFFEYLKKFLYTNKINPCILMNGEEVTDFCVFPYESLKGEYIFFDSVLQAEFFYSNKKKNGKAFLEKKERVKSIVLSVEKKLKKKLNAICSREKEALDYELNRIKGELILANIYKIKQGDSLVEADNYYDNSKIKISLDEKISPSKNAERYYKKYTKQKRTIEFLSPQKESIVSELEYLNTVSDELNLCENISDAESVFLELENYGLVKNTSKKNQTKKSPCFREYNVEGFRVKVGRNNTENDKLTFSASSEDIWFHVKDYHSAHLVLETNRKQVPDYVIEICAQICAYYSKCRQENKVEVVFTKKKFVKKPPKSKPGFCVYENFSSVFVCPDKKIEFVKNV